MDLKIYKPSMYVTTLQNMAANPDEANQVTAAVTSQMVTQYKPLNEALKSVTSRIKEMASTCQTIPRGYTTRGKETPGNTAEKHHPTSDKTVTMWEVHIPPPFPSINEHNPAARSKHDIWTNAFKITTFKSKNTVKGIVMTNLRFCYT